MKGLALRRVVVFSALVAAALLWEFLPAPTARQKVLASGGAGTVQHFIDAAAVGADALLAASVFHYGTLTIADVKAGLRGAGYEVR